MRTLRLLAMLLFLPACSEAVDQFGYRVLEKKPQDRRNYVQGLEIHDGLLYVSSGLYGQSRLSRYDFDSGTLQVSRQLNPRLFGEGLTLLGDRLFQLTWREGMLLEFNRADLTALAWHPIPGQGWGLTNDGKHLIYTDGSDKLHYVDPASKRIVRSVPVTEQDIPVDRLNELEWIEGSIWANIYQTDRIVIIDPATGKVTGSIDLTGLLPEAERLPDTDVLNGIARDPRDGAIWITGKRWPWLYRIELVSSDAGPDS